MKSDKPKVIRDHSHSQKLSDVELQRQSSQRLLFSLRALSIVFAIDA